MYVPGGSLGLCKSFGAISMSIFRIFSKNSQTCDDKRGFFSFFP